jgi:hypothetical protein
MRDRIVTAACSAVVSVGVTLAVLAVTEARSVEAQPRQSIQTTGVEIVGIDGRSWGYFGLTHVGTVGLWINDGQGRARIEVTFNNSAVSVPTIRIYDETPAPGPMMAPEPIWRAP